MKLNAKLLIIILILALAMRTYSLRLYAFLGNDPFLHASVIRQYMETGNLDTYELTGGMKRINEPKGLYWVTILPALMDVPYVTAFQCMPIISGLISVILFYYLLKNLFNNRTALIGAFLLALNVGHAYRTMANFYRGDGFFLTFLLGVMLTYELMLKEKKKGRQLMLACLSALLITGMITVWNGHLLGIAIIIAWLLITQAIAYYKGEKEVTRKLLIYELIVLPTYLLFNWLFMNNGVITNLFLYAPGAIEAHTILVLMPAILSMICYLSIKLKKKARIIIMLSLFSGALIFAGLNSSLISGVLSTSIFFTSKIYTIGVSELLAPTPYLTWAMHNISYYFMWPGLILFALMLTRMKEWGRLMLLAYTIPVLFLMLNYGRYSFLGAVITTSMTAVILNYGYSQAKKIKQFKKLAIGIPITVLTIYSIVSANTIPLFNPRVDVEWIPALEWVKDNLEPGITASWWDHGSWIQYYTEFPTLVDSVYGQVEHRIKRIAKFLVTDNNDTFKDVNASYLILGNDNLFYIEAILGLANETGYEIFFPDQSQVQMFKLYTDRTVYEDPAGAETLIKKRMYANETGTSEVVSQEGNGCLIINPRMAFYANDKACNSNLVKLLFSNETGGYELLYANNFVRIYKIT